MAIAHLPPFAKLLRHYRTEAQLTQEELAERAGLSARTISDLERGVKTKPHRVTVELLADALHLTAEERTALLAAVPRAAGSQTNAAHHPPAWLGADLPLGLGEARQVQCPHELRQMIEGLVALYVDEERRDRRINITLIVLSVGESLAVR